MGAGNDVRGTAAERGEARGARARAGPRSTRERRLLDTGAAAVGAWVLGLALVIVVAAAEGSPFHPALPEGVRAWGPLGPVARGLGVESLSRDALAAVGIVAIVVAVGGFLLLLRAAWQGHVSARTVVVLAVLGHVAVLLVPLFFSRDVYSYAMYGRIRSLHGANPYVAVPADVASDPVFALVGRQWRETPAVYGAAFTSLSAGLTRALRDLTALITAYRLLMAAASLGTLGLVVALARRVRPGRAAFAAALVGANPVILFHSVGGGHNDLLVGLAIAGGLALVFADRTLLAAAVLALGALVKAPAALPLLLLVVVVTARRPSGERLRAAAAHVAVAVAVALPFIVPFANGRDPTLGLVTLAGHEGWLAPSRFFRRSLGRLAGAIGGDGLETVVEVAVRVAFPVLFVLTLAMLLRALARRAPSLGSAEHGAAWGWALVAFMLTAPVLLPWYVAWLVPLAWLLPRIPRLGAVVLSVVLAATEVVAEPLRSPRIFEGMVLGLHYVATPVAFGVLIWVLVDLRRRVRAAAPLDAEEGEQVASAAGDG